MGPRVVIVGAGFGTRITTNWPGRVTEYRARTATVDWTELEEA